MLYARHTIIAHGIGDQDWLTLAGPQYVSDYLGRPAHELTLFDYSRVLDGSRWHGLLARIQLVGGILADVFGYFRDQSTRKAIVDKAVSLLKSSLEKYERVDVVAHSLGSVVFWEAAQQLKPTERNRLRLVLLGSPLAWKFLRKGSARLQGIWKLEVYAGTRDLVARWGAKWLPDKLGTHHRLMGWSHDIEDYWQAVPSD